MLKIARIGLSVIIVIVATYMLITRNFEFMPYNIFLLSVLMAVMGADELKKGRKGYGYLGIAASLFCFFVTFQVVFFA
ncbi:DUF3953 domain-containing protein [Bacillus seohaeanensis]|uniref:DUF3953 domain-containing protein n=1 Tax=Bacillus seohaeanensis TaxID=284580 RepID=A0ABW5RNR1_9BACI